MKNSHLLNTLCFFCFTLVTSTTHAVLLGAAHNGRDGPSTLYEIDPLTGVTTPVGPIGFERCSAMDFDASGTLYATCERTDGSNTHVLITIDPSTGAGTEVGPTGIEFFPGGNDATMPDISFRPSNGTLYGWNFPSLDRPAGFFGGLSTINLGTGAATLVGYATGVLADDGSALAFSPSSVLLYAAGEGPTGSTCTQGLGTSNCDDVLHLVDESTAAASMLTTLSFPAAPSGVPDLRDPRPNAMDFDPATGTLFASVVYGFGGTTSHLLTQIDTTTGDVTIIGPTVSGLDALAFLPPPLSCDIQMSQATYIDGETVTADVFRITNLNAASLALEWKVWLGVPGVSPIGVVNVGADGTFVLPAGTDVDLGPLPLLAVTAALPRGGYEFSCRMLDPVTGELLAEDRNFFEIQAPNTFDVGDAGPAGGIVFHVTDGGLHGLEAAPVDQAEPFAPGAEWGCSGVLIPDADGTAIGTGAQNTADILAGCATPGIAARLADAYTLNGFDDWFLPSQDELNALYLNRAVVGGLSTLTYWSSSEFVGNIAWTQNFFDGTQFGETKDLTSGVRAVRAF